MTTIKVPTEYNIYLNPQYYFDQSTLKDGFQKWLDQPVQYNNKPIETTDTIIQFPITTETYYPFNPSNPIRTNRDILLACNEFYFETEIDREYAHFNRLPNETGYWYFNLDNTGSILKEIEIKDTDEIIIRLAKKADNNEPTDNRIVSNQCILCKKCYTMNMPQKLNKNCTRCRTILTPNNIKF